ncbi:MAG: NADH-quinone oxidoreductase subunit J [Caulobacterales bacterium]|nr:NADH-quinone oxidoreductase subunit J [Caulobacterales bacterium]
MVLQAAAFYVLAFIACASAFMVVAARNPVRSVMFLIMTFFTSAGLFVLIGAEFLAMLLVVVYVGAVAVLFLFVVMMLDVDFVELRQGFLQYLPFGALVALILLIELIFVGATTQIAGAPGQPPIAGAAGVTNAEAIGQVLYDEYVYVFQASGIVLLIAMIGAIVLTLRHREGVRRQDVGAQVGRSRKEAVELVDVKPGQGL